MKSKRADAAMASLCREVHPEDGIPPHLIRKPASPRREEGRPDVSALRFTKAAVRAIEATLTQCDDGALDSLSIGAAVLLPGGAVLEVTIHAPEHRHADIPDLEVKLRSLSGSFRAAIAAEVNRRRTPHLRMRAIPGKV